MSGSLYVYALVGVRELPAGATGIDGAALRLVRAGDLAAVVHDHDGEAYGGPEDEVRRRALEHNAVVERLWQEDRATLPMSFDVIVAPSVTESAERRLHDWLESVAAPASARLATLRGRVELRIDVGLDPVAAAGDDDEVLALRRQAVSSSPGVLRLLSKRVQRLERDVTERLADALYAEVRERLARLSADIVENSRSSAEPGEVLVLSASLLADEDEVPAVGRTLGAIAAEQPAARVHFYGPWPPYSFADLPGSTAGSGTLSAPG